MFNNIQDNTITNSPLQKKSAIRKIIAQKKSAKMRYQIILNFISILSKVFIFVSFYPRIRKEEKNKEKEMDRGNFLPPDNSNEKE